MLGLRRMVLVAASLTLTMATHAVAQRYGGDTPSMPGIPGDWSNPNTSSNPFPGVTPSYPSTNPYPGPTFNNGYNPNVSSGFGFYGAFTDSNGNTYRPLSNGEYVDNNGVIYRPNGVGGYITSEGRTLSRDGSNFRYNDDGTVLINNGNNSYGVIGGAGNVGTYRPGVGTRPAPVPSQAQKQNPCYCGLHSGYCMIFRSGAASAIQATPAAACSIKDCQRLYRSTINGQCERYWRYWQGG